jgi:flavin-dependent dehydrogenase
VPRLVELPWRGTPALTRRAVRLWAERVLVLGDAAGYVEPFTGEGISWALASAVAVTPLAVRAAAHWDTSVGREWATVHGRVIAGRQGTCRVTARVLRHPRLFGPIIRLLGRWPGLAAPVMRRLNAVRDLPRSDPP